MRKYNYFDDDPEELEIKTSSKVNIDFSSFARKARYTVEDFIHSNSFDDAKALLRLPNFSSMLFKAAAFVIFVVIIVVFILIFSHTINSQNDKIDKFYNDAGKVCTDYITEYGIPKFDSLDSADYGKGMARLTGLCYARQMDFNNDGDAELMLCYNNKNVYTLEVWGYNGKDFVKLYSDVANSTNDIKDGSWISFYYKNNKYYICKSTADDPSKVKMLNLKGDSFKESLSCDYDYKNDIYSIKGKINAQDFETIKLSVIKASKAESIIDTVTDNIDSFHTVSLPAINNQRSDAERKAEAYYKIIEARNEKYGKAKIAKDKGLTYIEGLAYVDLIDFDGDDNEELVLVYRKMLKQSATNAYNGQFIIIENPTYCVEVYSWNGTVTKKVFNSDTVSNYFGDNDVSYLMLRIDEKSAAICSNVYNYSSDYNYTAASRIYEYKNGSFDSVFSARLINDYGYKNYYIDGEYTYKSTFEDKAYRVPKFMNDEGSYDKDKFSLVYFAGENESGFNDTINETVKTIESLNKNYVPND